MTGSDAFRDESAGSHRGRRLTLPADVMAVVLTHRRERLATEVVRGLIDNEGFSPDKILLVINGEGGLTDSALERQIICLRLTSNLGPAGGFREGLTHAIAAGARWIYVCEDDVSLFDLPTPRVAALLDRLEEYGTSDVGGVAAYGRVLDRKTGRATPYRPDSSTPSFADIDVAAWGATLVSREVIEAGVLPDKSLFFGYEDHDFWLNASRHGFRLLLDTETARVTEGRVFADGRKDAHSGDRPTDQVEPWRKYYEARNFIYLAQRHGTIRWLAAHGLRTLRRMQLAPTWAHRRAAMRGLVDGVLGRIGHNDRYMRNQGEFRDTGISSSPVE